MSETTSAVPRGCTYPNCQTSAGCHGECEREQRRAMFAADKSPMTTPPDDLPKLAERPERLADRLEAFARDAAKLDGHAHSHVLKTIGGCVCRNIGEIVAALRERDARLS